MANAEKLRSLAAWYREFAEKAGNPMIWELRLRTAEDLEKAAERVERDARNKTSGPPISPNRHQH